MDQCKDVQFGSQRVPGHRNVEEKEQAGGFVRWGCVLDGRSEPPAGHYAGRNFLQQKLIARAFGPG